MIKKEIILLAVILLPTLTLTETRASLPPDQQAVLQVWLSVISAYRLATEADCKCQENLTDIRKGGGGWQPNSNYHPFYASGDFNIDGKTDFAVILIKGATQQYLAIFNGPFHPGSKPVYLAVQTGAIFYGAPRPRPYRLIVGEFATEGVALLPKGKGYVLATGQ